MTRVTVGHGQVGQQKFSLLLSTHHVPRAAATPPCLPCAADVLDLVEFLSAQLTGTHKRIVIVGYSWGACLAAYGLTHAAVIGYVGRVPSLCSSTAPPCVGTCHRPALGSLRQLSAGCCAGMAWQLTAALPACWALQAQTFPPRPRLLCACPHAHPAHPHALPTPTPCSVSFPLGGLSFVLQTKKHWQELCRARHLPRLLLLGRQDQHTKAATLQGVVEDAGGCLLEEDDSYQPVQQGPLEAWAAAAAAAAAGAGAAGDSPGTFSGAAGSSSGSPVAPGLAAVGSAPLQPNLQLRFFDANDHFWMNDCSRAAEYVVGWIETIAKRDAVAHS